MTEKDLNERLFSILDRYSKNFCSKTYIDEAQDSDVLMNVFGITQEIKGENKQYWGRELGMCWQLIINQVFATFRNDYKPAIKYGLDEPADLFIENDAIDTKYRVGSGDSGTLKKFKIYGKLLSEKGFRPVLLFLRNDNLPAAITACKMGGWHVYTGDDSFAYIFEKTGFDLKAWLLAGANSEQFLITRK